MSLSRLKSFVVDIFGSQKAMLNTPMKAVFKQSSNDDVPLTLSLENHNVFIGKVSNDDMSSEDKKAIARQIEALWNERNAWRSVDTFLPKCPHEHNEEHDEDGYPQWEGYVSASLEISDGYNLARGHYRDDGVWVVYDAEYDFQLVKPEDVTHWKPLPKPPHLEK